MMLNELKTRELPVNPIEERQRCLFKSRDLASIVVPLELVSGRIRRTRKRFQVKVFKLSSSKICPRRFKDTETMSIILFEGICVRDTQGTRSLSKTPVAAAAAAQGQG